MSTAKNTLYAAVGAGATAIEKAKELPQVVITLPAKIQAKSGDIRELPKQIRSIDLREQAKLLNLNPQALVEQAKSLSTTASERATKAFAEFTKVGEKTVKQLRKSSKTTTAKKTTAKAKASAPKKVAEANGTAAEPTTASQN